MDANIYYKTMDDAYKGLSGAWSNVDDTVAFMFTNPDINYNQKALTYKINNETESTTYFLSILDTNKFRLHIQVPTKMFSDRLILEFIGKDTIELRYYDEYVFTLLRVDDRDIPKFFEV